jgi:hypothetical protein
MQIWTLWFFTAIVVGTYEGVGVGVWLQQGITPRQAHIFGAHGNCHCSFPNKQLISAIVSHAHTRTHTRASMQVPVYRR